MNNPFEKFMQQAKTFQESTKKIQAELILIQVTGEAGAGMVKVIMDGHYHIQAIDIDEEIYKEGKSLVTSLMMAAANDAANKVKRAIEEKMSKLAKSFGLPANINFPFMPFSE
jgi:DNA-binding YbaB/EbfC family protein